MVLCQIEKMICTYVYEIVLFSVPITGVTMTTPQTNILTIMETHSATFECTTSGGLPASDVRWYKDCGSSDTKDDQLLFESTANAIPVIIYL